MAKAEAETRTWAETQAETRAQTETQVWVQDQASAPPQTEKDSRLYDLLILQSLTLVMSSQTQNKNIHDPEELVSFDT